MNRMARMMVTLLLCASVALAQTPAPAKHAKPKAKVQEKAQEKTAEQMQLEQTNQQLLDNMRKIQAQMDEMRQQLQQAQKDAAAAKTEAAEASRKAEGVEQATTANAGAVNTLQSAVTDLKGNAAAIAQTIQDDQKQTKAAIEHPDMLHYKGITLSSAGSFTAAETVDRNHATGGDIPTAWTSIPLTGSDMSKVSEFFGSGRQSRLALMAESKGAHNTFRGYFEMDFLGSGTNSNNNQSNSYVMRQRQIWGQLETASGWSFAGGQMWSLATEYKSGLTLRTEATPQSIDPNYVPGFVWARQYGFRITKQVNPHLWAAASLENPQTLTPVVNGDVTGLPLILWASSGANGGNYNAAANTSNGSTPGLLTTYSMNAVPDFIAKLAYEPRWGGHYEIFGVSRFFRARLYPNATKAEIAAGTATSAGAYNDTESGGGIGASARRAVLGKRFDLGLKGLWGTGMGRYGTSTIADVTARPDGKLSPLHTWSALSTVEWHATPRFDVYANYGGDYVKRTHYTNLTTGNPLGYGVGTISSYTNAGCNTEPVPTGTGGTTNYPTTPSSCSATNRDIQEFTVGYWYDFYKGSRGRFRQGIQYGYAQRKTWADLNGLAPEGLDNIFETSFRYYLP